MFNWFLEIGCKNRENLEINGLADAKKGFFWLHYPQKAFGYWLLAFGGLAIGHFGGTKLEPNPVMVSKAEP